MPAQTARRPAKPPARYHHGDLRAALVAEARRMLAAEGPEAVSLRRVAQAAGVSAAAPYHHFPDKRALLAAVAAEGFRAFAAALEAGGREAADPKDRLKRLGAAYVEFALAQPQLFRLMQGPAFQSGEMPAELSEAATTAYGLLDRAVRDCLPEAEEREIEAARAAAWSLVHGLATLGNDGRLREFIAARGSDAAAAAVTDQLDILRVRTGKAAS